MDVLIANPLTAEESSATSRVAITLHVRDYPSTPEAAGYFSLCAQLEKGRSAGGVDPRTHAATNKASRTVSCCLHGGEVNGKVMYPVDGAMRVPLPACI